MTTCWIDSPPPPPEIHRDRNGRKRGSGAQRYHVGNLDILKVIGIYRLTPKDIYSHNLGITYRTYRMINFSWIATTHGTYLHYNHHGITLPWFASHGNSLPRLVIPLVRLYVNSINILLWDGDENVLGSVPYQVCIWGLLQDSMNLSSEFWEVCTLQWFGKVDGQNFPHWSIFDLQDPHSYYILNQEVSGAYVFCTISTW